MAKATCAAPTTCQHSVVHPFRVLPVALGRKLKASFTGRKLRLRGICNDLSKVTQRQSQSLNLGPPDPKAHILLFHPVSHEGSL